MTLDCRIFRSLQPRVIFLRSWYLTSLINLSFCRFRHQPSSDLFFLPHSLQPLFVVLPLSEWLIFERNYSSDLWLRPLAHFLSLWLWIPFFSGLPDFLSSFHTFFCIFLTIYICWSFFTRSSVSTAHAFSWSLWEFYLYIGITLSDCNIAQFFRNFNMVNCIKSQLRHCIKHRFPSLEEVIHWHRIPKSVIVSMLGRSMTCPFLSDFL